MRREKKYLADRLGGKKNFLPTRLLEKKILADQKSPTPPPSRVKWSAPYDVTNAQGLFCQLKEDVKYKQQLVLLKTICFHANDNLPL